LRLSIGSGRTKKKAKESTKRKLKALKRTAPEVKVLLKTKCS